MSNGDWGGSRMDLLSAKAQVVQKTLTDFQIALRAAVEAGLDVEVEVYENRALSDHKAYPRVTAKTSLPL